MPTITDGRGHRTTTGALVLAALVLVFAKFAFSGLELGPLTTSPMGAGEFGAAVMAILAPWIAREWKEKDKGAAGD